MERASDGSLWPFVPHGTCLQELSVMASLSLCLLSSVRRKHSYVLSMILRNAQRHTSPCSHRLAQRPPQALGHGPLPSGMTHREGPKYLPPQLLSGSRLSLLRPPPPTRVLQPLACSSPGAGPAPAMETHDSSVFCGSQMTSIQHSRLPFISLLFFMFAVCFCHPIWAFKAPHCACLEAENDL